MRTEVQFSFFELQINHWKKEKSRTINLQSLASKIETYGTDHEHTSPTQPTDPLATA